MKVCNQNNVKVIEDCAHTMGAKWRDTWSGRYGVVGCYSTQTYKHINSGEGGFLITDNAQVMARAIILSGSYMLYDRHLVAPDPKEFEKIRYETPNISGRMDHLRASILRPQLRRLSAQSDTWNVRYRTVENGLKDTPGLQIIRRPAEEAYVGSSIQFLLLDWNKKAVQYVVARCAERGVELKWFGDEEPVGFTSRYDSWTYAPSSAMPKSDRILAGLLDMRIPLTFSIEDCALIAHIIRTEVSAVYQSMPEFV
jgi:dTDP-4-amino-4,6-dideoxygalactose transaminase